MSIFKFDIHFLLLKCAVVLVAALSCVLVFFPRYSYAYGGEMMVSQTLYHRHVGKEGVYGGCYTREETKTETVEIECKGTMVYWPDLGTSSCDKCGASYTGDQSGRGCWTTTTETVTKTDYKLGCNMTENTSLGTVTVHKDTNEWTKTVVLSASFQVDPKVKVNQNAFIWNGGTPTNDPQYTVTENGTYSMELNAGTNVDTQKGTAYINVDNIDNRGPMLSSYRQQPDREWTNDVVRILDMRIQDIQQSGQEGCGVHWAPVSIDGGATWIAKEQLAFERSGLHRVLLRDRLENISAVDIQIRNIDKTPPIVRMEYPKNTNMHSVTLKITAVDRQPDGSEGCGLASSAFSWDGGKTWGSDPEYTVYENTIVKIAVRDKLGNIMHLEEMISNIDNLGPVLEYKIAPETWTKDPVTVCLSGKDVNENGTDGAGLPQEWYSIDGGRNWRSENEFTVEENKKLEIILRDIHDNQTRQQLVIDNIDKCPPKISVKQKRIETAGALKVELVVNAVDEQSGLEDKAYSWDNGVTYSEQASKVVSASGTYTVKVCDKVGNVGEVQVKVNLTTQPEESEEESESGEPESKEESEEETSTEEEETTEIETEPVSTQEPESAEEKVQETTEPEEETETVFVTLEERVDEPEQVVKKQTGPVKETNRGKLLAAVLSALVALFLVLLILAGWIRSVAVFGKNRKGEWCYLGRVWILHEEEKYSVHITEKMYEKCETAQFCFKLAWGFVQMHEAEEIYFHFPEEICMTGRICEKIEMALF